VLGVVRPEGPKAPRRGLEKPQNGPKPRTPLHISKFPPNRLVCARFDVSCAAVSQHLQRAHRAANKQIQHDGDETATVAWEDYCRAQGGVGCGRGAAIKLTMRKTDTLGRYGDAAQPRPVGVETWGLHGSDDQTQAQQARCWQVESERRVWTIERAPVRRLDWRTFDAGSAKPAQSRTRVNNCTDYASVNDVGLQVTPPSLGHISDLDPPCTTGERAVHLKSQDGLQTCRSSACSQVLGEQPPRSASSAQPDS